MKTCDSCTHCIVMKGKPHNMCGLHDYRVMRNY